MPRPTRRSAGATRLGCPRCGYRVELDAESGWWLCARLDCRWCESDDRWLGDAEWPAPAPAEETP